jgi:hypothetical protein
VAHTLMTRNLEQLEVLCATADRKMLSQLEDELRYRQAPRALTLLIRVRAALRGPPRLEGVSTGSSRDADEPVGAGKWLA